MSQAARPATGTRQRTRTPNRARASRRTPAARPSGPARTHHGESVRLTSRRAGETATSRQGTQVNQALAGAYGHSASAEHPASAEEKKPSWMLSREERQRIAAERAGKNNEIPGLRQGLQQLKDPDGRAIDGTGRRVGFIELNHNTAEDRGDTHSQGVRDVIGGREQGVAPGAETRGYGLRRGPDDHRDPNLFPHTDPGFGTARPDENRYEDSRTSLNGLIDTASTGLLDRATERLTEIQQAQERFDAINLSVSGGPASLYTQTDRLLNDGPIRIADGSKIYDYPEMRRAVLGEDAGRLTREQQWQRVVDYVDRRLANPEGRFPASLGAYQRAVRNLTESGTSVVVAAGNDGAELARFPTNPPGATLNFLARSPHVVTVGASDSQGTPGLRSDDQIPSWSSRGDGQVKGSNPTIAAPGSYVLANGAPISGTSFASPYVAGTIALMRQANPNLTAAEVREVLTGSAEDTDGAGREAEGAGILDPVRAVRAALTR